MSDQKNFFIMPFRYVVSGNGAMKESQYYSKDGTPFYSMIEPSREPLPEDDVEFNSDIYCKLISITNSKEAAAFFEEYPKIRFAYVYKDANTRFAFPAHEYETIDMYYRRMVSAISVYNMVREFMTLEEEYRKTQSIEIRNQAVDLFKRYFAIIEKGNPARRSYHLLFLNEYGSLMYEMCQSKEVVALACQNGNHQDIDYALRNDAISYRDIIIAYFDGDEDKAQEQLVYLESVYDKIFAIACQDISSYCRTIMQRIDMSFSPDLRSFVCRCPDLLSAMYLMTYVALHNGDKYAMCQHKNCHQYYLVNSETRYAQTRCPKHMKARQTRRKNQAARMKNFEF